MIRLDDGLKKAHAVIVNLSENRDFWMKLAKDRSIEIIRLSQQNCNLIDQRDSLLDDIEEFKKVLEGYNKW